MTQKFAWPFLKNKIPKFAIRRCLESDQFDWVQVHFKAGVTLAILI